MKKLILLLFLFTISLNASPTIYGPTGLIEMPTAESVAYKQVNLAVDYSVNNNSDEDNGENEFYYKFNLGSFENWELGVLGGSFIDEGVFVNMKYFLMSNQEENPLSIAAGFERIGSNTDLATYLVASKRIEGGIHMHFGFKAFLQDGLSAVAMFGGEYFTDEKMAVLLDITGEKDEAYVLNSGVRFLVDNDVSLRVYLIDLTKSRAAKETLYTFGMSVSKFM